MKNMKTVLAAVSAMALLAGCTDAKAKLADANTEVMRIGNTVITKGDIYSEMFATSGANTAYFNAQKEITSNEIEVTEEMKQAAQSTLSYYEVMYGDSFTSYLEAAGMTEDEYVEENLLPAQMANKLVEKYITENYESLCEEYNPIKATILTFTSEDDANAALSALKDGSKTAAEAASENNSDSNGESTLITKNTTSFDSAVLTVVRSNQPDDGWTMVPSSVEGTYYVAKVDDNTPANYQDEVVSALSANSTITDASTTYYFNKYGFNVYDIDLYKALQTSNPAALAKN